MKLVDILLAISVSVIWGMGFIFAKAAIEHFPPILLMALRFTLTGLAMAWFVRPPWHLLSRVFLIALVSAAIQYSLTFTGLKGLDASTASLVVQLEVPFGALMAWIVFRDRLGWRRTFGMLLAFVGVTLIAGEPRYEDNLTSILLVVGGAFTWAMGQIMIKKLGVVGGFNLIAWVAICAAPQLFVASWIIEDGQWDAIKNAPPIVWTTVLYLGLVMTALGYGIWYHLLARYDANQVLPFLLLLPVTAVAGGVLFLGETLTFNIVVGGAVAILGVAVINLWPTSVRK
ncbi:MAG: EamA family transporter [Lysobacterales bacterium]|nr:MAG: EamA family transporter [Xanthomonadales bacterium]